MDLLLKLPDAMNYKRCIDINVKRIVAKVFERSFDRTRNFSRKEKNIHDRCLNFFNKRVEYRPALASRRKILRSCWREGQGREVSVPRVRVSS